MRGVRTRSLDVGYLSDGRTEFNLVRRSARTILEQLANLDDAGPCPPARENQ